MTRLRTQARRSQHPEFLPRASSIKSEKSKTKRSMYSWVVSKVKRGTSAVLNYALDWVDDRRMTVPPEDISLNDPSLDGLSL